ncbi:MAG: hypothetical protein LBE85_09335 [Candidatus Accumulibacter sp.]|jgi:hypothetical protein|nr:hypothetical protein [Accumulibacter sp.]
MSADEGGERSGNSVSGRRRSFVATRRKPVDADGDGLPAGTEESPEELQTPGDEDEDDLPVLTEIVPAEEEEAPAPALPVPPAEPAAEAPAPPAVADIEELAARMVQAIDHQMAYELPTLIEATLLNFTADLRNGIRSTMEDALREFVARHKEARSGEE